MHTQKFIVAFRWYVRFPATGVATDSWMVPNPECMHAQKSFIWVIAKQKFRECFV